MRARTALKHCAHLSRDVCVSPSRGRGCPPAATISQARLRCSSSFTAVSPVSWRQRGTTALWAGAVVQLGRR